LKILDLEGTVDSKYTGSESTMGIRPQQTRISEIKGQGFDIPGLVKIIEFQGDTSILIVELSDADKTEIKVVVPAGGIRLKRGDTCWLEFGSKFIHLFDETELAIIKR
jgi:hypothetical protein